MTSSEKVYLDQIRLLSENLPRGMILNSIVPIPFAIIMLWQANRMLVVSWLIFFYVVIFLRVLAHRYLIPPVRDKAITPGTRYLYALSSLVAGSAWGSTMLIFKPVSLLEFLPIALTLASVMAGGISVLSYVLISYVAFVLPMAILFAVSFFLFDNQMEVAIGILVMIYVLACLYFSRTFNRVLTETLQLRHENEELLHDLRIKKEVAEQANRSKSQFLAAASHDLRQPLHALSMLFEALQQTDSDNVKSQLYPKIEASIDSLSGLFNSLLDIAKLDAGSIVAKYEDIDTTNIIQSFKYQYEADAKQKNLSIRMHCANQIVYTDRLFLERILGNLISNAIRYTEKGGILVSCRSRGKFVLLQVWDTGIGIDEQEINNVFREFYQLNNPQRDRKLGLGIGLSIVRRLCDLLGCSVELRSRPGSGTVVSILLPKGEVSRIDNASGLESTRKWQLAGMRVFMIEDDIEVLNATSLLLSKWGCVVKTAKSASEALENIEFAEKADLILSDLRLPGETNGIELLDLICERVGKVIPAVVITGDTGPEQIKLIQKSHYRILHKPLKPAQLRTAIHMVLTDKKTENPI